MHAYMCIRIYVYMYIRIYAYANYLDNHKLLHNDVPRLVSIYVYIHVYMHIRTYAYKKKKRKKKITQILMNSCTMMSHALSATCANTSDIPEVCASAKRALFLRQKRPSH